MFTAHCAYITTMREVMQHTYLKSICINKYAGYIDQKIDFDKKINLFIGKNGAGKTFFLKNVLSPILSLDFKSFDVSEGIDISFDLEFTDNENNYEIQYKLFAEPTLINISSPFMIEAIFKNADTKEEIFKYSQDNLSEVLNFKLNSQVISFEKQVENFYFYKNSAHTNIVTRLLNSEEHTELKNNLGIYLNYVQFVISGRFFKFSASSNLSLTAFSNVESSLPGDFQFSAALLQDFFKCELKIKVMESGWSSQGGNDPHTLFGEFFTYFLRQEVVSCVNSNTAINVQNIIKNINTEFSNVEHVDYFLKTSRFKKINFQLLSEFVEDISSKDGNWKSFKLNLQVLIEDYNAEVKPLFLALTEGERRFLSYCLMINLVSDSYFLIDEIENGLHPEWISHIMKAPHRQLFISSHNPFVVNNFLSVADVDGFDKSNSVHICETKKNNKSFKISSIAPELKKHISLALKRDTDFSKLLTKYKVW